MLVTGCHSAAQAVAVAALATYDAPHLPLLIDVGRDWLLWEETIYAASLSSRTALVVRAADLLASGGADHGQLLWAQEMGLVLCQDSNEARQFIEAASRDARLFSVPVAIIDEEAGEIIPRLITIPEKFAIHDEFMRPLEPLADNLVAGLYFAMEMDGTKYEAYRDAIRDAIRTLPSDGPLSIMIVGAGRGPLVEAVLQVLEGGERADNRVVVVEKNANVFATLYSKHRTIWPRRYPRSAGTLELHLAAIGELQLEDGEFRAQLIVSELLGSFGDNELAPECVGQAHRFLAPGGLMIPTSSTSYLLPVCYPRSRRILAKAASPSLAETPSVVYAVGIVPLCAEGAAVFHYNYADPHDCAILDRRARLQFTLSDRGQLDGFMGYFEAHLFGEHYLSISPSLEQSAGRDSWFPVFFPIARPPSQPPPSSAGVTTLQVERATSNDGDSVWYEWCLSSGGGEARPICNAGGRHYRIQTRPDIFI